MFGTSWRDFIARLHDCGAVLSRPRSRRNLLRCGATILLALALVAGFFPIFQFSGTVRAASIDTAREAGKLFSAGYNHSLVLKADGTVYGWGNNDIGQCDAPAGLSDVVAVSAGTCYSLALKDDGTVTAWWYNGDGQCSVPVDLSDVVAISAGYTHSLALKADGTVSGWGNNDMGQCDAPAGLSDVVAVSAGYNHSLLLKADGTVYGWGNNDMGQCDAPAGLSDVVAVSAGAYHSLALKDDGTVAVWGGGSVAPVGLDNVVAVSGGDDHFLALKADGTVVAWGNNNYGQCNVPADLSNVVAVSAGAYYSLALKDDGTMVAWGNNHYGQSTVPVGLNLGGQFLSSLQAGAFLLAPEFNPDVFSYSVWVPHGVTGLKITALPADQANDSVRINGEPQDNGMPYTVSPLVVGPNPVSVEVVSSAGIITQYSVTIHRYSTATNTSPIGDVNGDGVLDISDAILILRRIVGLIDAFPVERP